MCKVESIMTLTRTASKFFDSFLVELINKHWDDYITPSRAFTLDNRTRFAAPDGLAHLPTIQDMTNRTNNWIYEDTPLLLNYQSRQRHQLEYLNLKPQDPMRMMKMMLGMPQKVPRMYKTVKKFEWVFRSYFFFSVSSERCKNFESFCV